MGAEWDKVESGVFSPSEWDLMNCGACVCASSLHILGRARSRDNFLKIGS